MNRPNSMTVVTLKQFLNEVKVIYFSQAISMSSYQHNQEHMLFYSSSMMTMMMMMKLPILPCAEKLELVLSTYVCAPVSHYC